jgi:hypothetical protein
MFFSFNPQNYSTTNFNYTKDSFSHNINKSLSKCKENQEKFMKKQKDKKSS